MARLSWMGHSYIAGHPGISDFLSILGHLSRSNIQPLPKAGRISQIAQQEIDLS
jgi:hypothetical protein